MRTVIENMTYDNERALYGSSDLSVVNCRFDGPADGESAFKECSEISARSCLFNLRYPFWHDSCVILSDCTMTELCRAAIWYSKDVTITNSVLHGIKALRECQRVAISDCDIISPEFGWSINDITMKKSSAVGEYFMLRSQNLSFFEVDLKGKYSFQYIKNATFRYCSFDTKDAFWHGENVTLQNCTVKGEYLGWYSNGLTLKDCTIIGTQPFCYCRNLRLMNCKMIDCDLAFERSEVHASLLTPILSIKNPISGRIRVPAVGEIIRDSYEYKAEILVTD